MIMKKKRKRKKIRRILPLVGTKVKGKFFDKIYIAEIVFSKNLPNKKGVKYSGKVYPSMTAAAVAITKQPTNGWRFWKIQS